MALITIVSAVMMGSALVFPAIENKNKVRLVKTHLEKDIINACKNTGKHTKFDTPSPFRITYHQIEELENTLCGADFVIGGVSSFGVDWFAKKGLLLIPEHIPLLTVTKGLSFTSSH